MGSVAVGQVAFPFTLTGTDGKSYSLKNALSQGPALAVFFKVGCSTCQLTFPFVERIYQQLCDKGVQIWGISQDNARDSQRFASQYKITFPLLLDEDHYKTSREYGVKNTPTFFLIAPNGQVEMISDGFTKADLIEFQRKLAEELGTAPGELFRSDEKVPEHKPG